MSKYGRSVWGREYSVQYNTWKLSQLSHCATKLGLRPGSVLRNFTVEKGLEIRLSYLKLFTAFMSSTYFYMCDNWNNNNKIFLSWHFQNVVCHFFSVETRDIKNFVQILIYFIKQTLSKYEQKCCKLFQRSKMTFTSCFVVYPVC